MGKRCGSAGQSIILSAYLAAIWLVIEAIVEPNNTIYEL